MSKLRANAVESLTGGATDFPNSLSVQGKAIGTIQNPQFNGVVQGPYYKGFPRVLQSGGVNAVALPESGDILVGFAQGVSDNGVKLFASERFYLTGQTLTGLSNDQPSYITINRAGSLGAESLRPVVSEVEPVDLRNPPMLDNDIGGNVWQDAEGNRVDVSNFRDGADPWGSFDHVTVRGRSTGGDNFSKRWQTTWGGAPEWIRYRWAVPKVVNKYVIYSYDVNATPRDWEFQGSQNGSDWTTLDAQSDVTKGFWRRAYSFENETAYEYYRLLVTENNEGGTLTVHQLELHGPLQDAGQHWFNPATNQMQRWSGASSSWEPAEVAFLGSVDTDRNGDTTACSTYAYDTTWPTTGDIDARLYGAVGLGEWDEGRPLRDATFEAMRTGRVARWPSGEFLTSGVDYDPAQATEHLRTEGLFFTRTVTIRGEGRDKTTIRLTPYAFTDPVSGVFTLGAGFAPFVVMEDFTVDGSGAEMSGGNSSETEALDWIMVEHGSINRVTALRGRSEGFDFDKTHACQLTDCYALHCGGRGFSFNGLDSSINRIMGGEARGCGFDREDAAVRLRGPNNIAVGVVARDNYRGFHAQSGSIIESSLSIDNDNPDIGV